MDESAHKRPDPRGDYSLRQAAELLGLPVPRTRALARAAGLNGASFSFQDVVVLRSLAGLVAARVSPRAMRGALARLARSGESLAGMRLAAQGRAVVVRDHAGLWDAATGQGCLDFSAVSATPAQVVSLARRAAPGPEPISTELDADGWFDLAQSAEEQDPAAALEAYEQVLARRPGHFPTLINVGRLWHESGENARAEAAYRAAVTGSPDHPLGHFNLAVLLDDIGRGPEAIVAYRAAIELQPDFADAHFNLARLLEKSGDALGAVRHLARYRQLSR